MLHRKRFYSHGGRMVKIHKKSILKRNGGSIWESLFNVGKAILSNPEVQQHGLELVGKVAPKVISGVKKLFGGTGAVDNQNRLGETDGTVFNYQHQRGNNQYYPTVKEGGKSQLSNKNIKNLNKLISGNGLVRI